jgi:membrane-bound serine protease (ClpP class)
VTGLLLIFAGMLLSFMPAEPGGPMPFHWPRFEYTLTGLRNGLIAMSVSMVASLALAVVLSRFLPRIPVFGRVVAPNPMPADIAVGDPYGDLARIGDVGVAEGVLRPAGKARFGQVLVDVVTEGEYIEPGAQIEVIERHGNRVVVRPFRV